MSPGGRQKTPVFVEYAAVSAAFSRAVVVDLVAVDPDDVEVVAGMNSPS